MSNAVRHSHEHIHTLRSVWVRHAHEHHHSNPHPTSEQHHRPHGHTVAEKRDIRRQSGG